jgi:type II secretory pathway component GspD/PulD (secretin)
MLKRSLALTLCALVLGGCGGVMKIRESKELSKLLADLKANDDLIKLERKKREEQEIRQLVVHKDTDKYTVDIDARDAASDRLFARLMDAAGADYRMGDVELGGRVTFSGQGMPLMDVVGRILDPEGVTTSFDGNTLVLDYKPLPFLSGAIDPSTTTVTRNFTLRYMDTDTAFGLLDQTFPSPRPLNVAKLPERNMVVLTGPPMAVQEAITMLNRIDRYPKLVTIEALVIEFDSDAAEALGASVTNFTRDVLQNGSLQFGTPMAQFTYNSVLTNPVSFTMIINALFTQNKARLVSRPYVSTLSGKTASINLTTNQYVVVQQPSQGAPVYTTQAVKAGVVMNITPTVTSRGVVRLAMSVEDSQFVPTQGNTAVEVNDDQASTFMTLLDGQTTIIGGMVVKRASSDNSGLPWVRRIPILNLFTSSQEATEHHSEVAIYLTPHIIEAPSMDKNLIDPEALHMDPFWGNFTPTERLGHEESNLK